ncbi:DegV family protein [Clostridium chauvoei]|uniref:DegV family protein n=2 Tax=Clostridium chauvoei TaxID=46867 RepID=A0ABD4RI45_9CLOT|nr:DegV family protein [Clostridium chauvoei]ATD55355.1 fatty acid-binding protein DegV [Clostridium chauvoei]MBX7280867.1 DegV family protein [Clostridium chauvoei]MBX7283350.1 DegV family protein [Clostridium chauvoei]MBX7285824.1 DegV family protein [Clostridium chauvoei]MBX7288354.1 DegV family protein [Clostridium chauvoei]
MRTVIVTDSCCDLPIEFVKENNIEVLPIRVNLKGEDIPDDLGQTIKYREFYDMIRAGELPTTSQINSYAFKEVFKKHIDNGESVIYVGFSSALSGCVNSAKLAKEMLEEECGEVNVDIIDSKSASLGLGLIVYYLSNLLNSGSSKEAAVKWVEENKLKVNHWFTVDDLNHLKRGGRVSAAAATVGTVLNIKPILHVDDEGRLIPVSKVKGRKKSLKVLAEKLKEKIIDSENQVIFISHGDCEEDAIYLKDIILSSNSVKDIVINNIGPAVGSHSGPGTVALFFISDNRY